MKGVKRNVLNMRKGSDFGAAVIGGLFVVNVLRSNSKKSGRAFFHQYDNVERLHIFVTEVIFFLSF